ncbi:preprotein translocase subunit YajC [Glaciibacter psychrotolerans]|uniref:Preprotein translocase subunit YajC n=1 Tax=Glaciibacter psychrotolerans TaxID=670054 RepID=A0A7Z0J543_9MICO|nr:preprotein translocase subunit YajC [Leifsonia psychrotolerans]NYJ19042.1 preprotein translocase subunit YajC [Leifsonia psychrotolerans]
MDLMTLVMLAVLALLVFFMFRNGRKRKADQEKLQTTIVAGADVMTNFGLYGTIVSIDEEENKVALEIAPGTTVQIHRQTIARVVEPRDVEVLTDDEHAGVELNQDHATLLGEPEFGQRVDHDDIEPKKGDA